MSIGSGDLSTASEQHTDPPYTTTQVALSDWPPHVKTAWQVFQGVNKGDMVLWGERAQPLTVQEIVTTEEGQKDLHVEGPRGGTYTLRERYDDEGNPRFYADDSKAMDLRYVEGDTDEMRPFTEQMYESVVSNLKRAAINNYVQMDYDSYRATVKDVVNSWVSDVEFQRWSGWPYGWEDDDSTYIFRMVREHAGRLPETPPDQTTSPKNQARMILVEEVYERGREMAHERLIESYDDYRAVVLRLADNAIERNDLKAQMDARQAATSIVDEFIDAHSEPLWRSIIQHAETEPMDFEFYDFIDESDISREMALDILDQDVWARTRDLHAERGTHDPTIRGLAFFEYDELVELLVEDSLREHSINDNRLLYTTVNEVVRDFTDGVSRKEWPYEFGGVDTETWGAGDTEDIFTSITMHAEVDPQVFNPFARDKERKMATQVLNEVVHNRASNALDEEQLRATRPVPADEYLDEHFNGLTLNDIRNDTGIDAREYIRNAMEGMDAEEFDRLAGWTFVDELVEEADANVPFMSGQWVLVDYGLVRKDDRMRRISWFDRETGNVLTLQGQTDGKPIEGEFGYDTFNVQLAAWNNPEGEQYLVTDANLAYAFEWARDYIGANQADVNIIETKEGQHYVQEAIEEDDVDLRPFAADVAPDFALPGPGFTVDDALSYGTETFKRVGKWLTDNSRIVDATAKTAVALAFSETAWVMNRVAPGINVKPDYDTKHGVGITANYQFGAEGDELERYDPDDDSQAYTGNIQTNVRITPGAMKFIGDVASPDWLFQVDKDGQTTNAIQNLANKVEQPFQDATQDYGRTPRRVFVGAHIPATPMGRPQNANDYENPTAYTVNGNQVMAFYHLDTGQTLHDLDINNTPYERTGEAEIMHRLKRVGIHGYRVPWGGAEGYENRGDSAMRDAHDETRDPSKALDAAEIHELAWSMSRDQIIGSKKTRLVGTEDEVREKGNKIVISNKAFLNFVHEWPYVPDKSVLNTVWEFYKTRAKDSDEFTVFDAYDRFRMGLVYDAADRVNQRVLRETLRQTAAGNIPSDAPYNSFEGLWQQPTQREYYWNVGGELNSRDVFDPSITDEIPDIITFAEDNRPHPTISYTWYDESENVYKRYDHTTATNTEVTGAKTTEEYVKNYNLNSQSDIMSALLPSVRESISNTAQNSDDLSIVTSDDEWQPGDREEDRTWLESDEAQRLAKVSTGNVDWDDLDGTDLSVWGLFIRGMDMKTAAKMSDHWNLTDRFETRLSDVLPSNFSPSRPDVPSFDDWLDRRRGRNAIGSASDKARAKARYLSEIAGFDQQSVTARDVLGVSEGVMDESQRQRDLQEHHEDTDYHNYENFYGEQFGEAFDDVAQRYAGNEPVDDSQEYVIDMETEPADE